MKKEVRKTGEFVAHGADERTHRAIENTEDLDATCLGDREPKIHKLENGEHVNAIDGGGYEVDRSGMRLSRSDA